MVHISIFNESPTMIAEPSETPAPPSMRKRLKRYFHGWGVFFEAMHMQRTKKHGSGKRDWRSAIFIARCSRWIAAQQHRPDLNPFYGYGEEMAVTHALCGGWEMKEPMLANKEGEKWPLMRS